MKQDLKIKAFIISEDRNYLNLKINVHDTGLKKVHITTLNINRRNLSAFRQNLINEFNEIPELFIFDIELPSIISKQVIRRINQYIPKNIPAVILAKKQKKDNFFQNDSNAIKILINTTENTTEQQWLKDSVTNFWHSINYN